jgi:hypothetical protein
MLERRHIRRFTLALSAAAVVAGMAACVDLFHGTDFPTLCDQDAAACVSDTGPAADATVVPDAAAEGSAPIDLCSGATTTEARRRAEHACSYLGACLGPHDETRFGECVPRALAAYDCSFNPGLRPRGATAALWDCLWRASTCDAVALCVFGTPAPPCRSEPGLYSACNLERNEDGGFDPGSVVVACHDSTVALGMNPCELRGRTCAKLDDSKSLCAGARGASCTVGPRCEGTFAVSCRSAAGIHADEGADCARFGAGRCVLDDAGAACAPASSAPSCSETAKVVCNDAGTAESCVGGKAVAIDCAAIGQGCNADGVPPVDPILACRSLDGAAPCSETEDDCDGGTLVSCVRGVRYTLRCADVPGLGACTKTAGRRAACSL